MHARSKTGAGFTIVEVMIFLAISGLMFVLAINAMRGKQQQTEFNTGVSTLRSQLNEDLSNVVNGNYLALGNVRCNALSGGGMPQFTPGTPTPNGTCTIIGEVIAFTTDKNSNGQYYYTVYPLFGRNYKAGSTDLATTLTDAVPAITTYAQQELPMPFGLSISPTNTTATISPTGLGALGIVGFTSFEGGNATTNGQLNSGSSHVEVFAISTSSYANDHNTVSTSDTATRINGNLTDCNIGGVSSACIGGTINNQPINPPGGVTLCVDSGTDNESALFTIGGVNSPDSVTDQVHSNLGC